MGYKKPIEVKLQLTGKCNYDCDFCFNKQSNQNAFKSLSKKNAKKIISKIADEGIERVRFTGGEPLLHPSLLHLLSFAKRKGLYTTLNTNASLISLAKAKKIAKSADNVLVSTHSLPLNAKAAKAIKQLAKSECFVRAATILTKENIQNLEQFHRLFLSMPFSQWVLLRQIPNALNTQPVSSQDIREAVEKILLFNAKRKKRERFLIENALPFCCFEPERVKKIALGAVHEDGHSSLFVDTNATIRPSYFFGISLGSAVQDSFLGAWKSNFMRRMNALEFIAEECHSCKYAIKCMAGSRFSALLVNKSLYSLDPLAKPRLFLPELKRNK